MHTYIASCKIYGARFWTSLMLKLRGGGLQSQTVPNPKYRCIHNNRIFELAFNFDLFLNSVDDIVFFWKYVVLLPRVKCIPGLYWSLNWTEVDTCMMLRTAITTSPPNMGQSFWGCPTRLQFFFPRSHEKVFMVRKIQISKIDCKIEFIISGLVTWRLYFNEMWYS